MPDSCLSDEDALRWVMAAPWAGYDEAGRHLRGCAWCRERVAGLRLDLNMIEAGVANDIETVGGDCLDEATLAAFAAGDMTPGERDACMEHAAGCARCRREVASLVELFTQPEVATEVHRLDDVGARRGAGRRGLMGAGIALASAAAAIVLLVYQPHAEHEAATDHRGPTITAGTAPTPIAPIGDVVNAKTLRWNAVPGAEGYRITVFDADGRVLVEAQTADTATTLPDTVTFNPARTYLWKVEARTGWDRWASSELMPFTIHENAPRDSLRVLAPRLTDSALVAMVRARPLEIREAVTGTLALSVRGPPANRDHELTIARRLAAAEQTAWSDTFLVHEVARFTRWSPAQRLTKMFADSLRGAGNAASSQVGTAAAIGIWRRGLARSLSIGDTAGMAATIGNIGMTLAQDGQLDSAGLYLEHSRLLARSGGDLRAEANALDGLADVSEQRDDLSGARDRYARAIALRQRIGDSRGLAADDNNAGGLAETAGDLAGARRLYEAALTLNQHDARVAAAATNMVNLAGIAAADGEFARAEAYYRHAIAVWRPLTQWGDVADAMRGLGNLELRRGDYSAAGADLTEALTLYGRTGSLADAVSVRVELAGARAAAGALQEAIDVLRRAQQLADSAGLPPRSRASIVLARADLAVALNMRPEAERLYADAEQRYRGAGDRGGEAQAQEGRATLLLARGSLLDAKPLLDAAVQGALAVDNQRAASLTRISLGDWSLESGDTTAARQQLSRAATELQQLGDPVGAAAALGERASLDAGAGIPAAAAEYRAALATVSDHVAPEVTWSLHAGLGGILRAQGAPEDAARELHAAIADVERTGRSLALSERRSAFLTDKWDPYVQLALLERVRGHVEAAFLVSERLRASQMREDLANGRVAAPPDTAADLVAREQDLRFRIAELTRQVEGTPSGGQLLRGPDVARASAATRGALLQAEASYADLLLEIRERAPRHAALVSPPVAGWRDVARHVAPDEVFIEYLLADGPTSLAFVVTRDTMVAVALSVGRGTLAHLVDFVRGTISPRGTAGLDTLWRSPLRQLHRDLIAPIEATGLLRGKTRLTVVPHAELHYLPFAALLGGSPGNEAFLVEHYQIAVTPSASVWLALGARTPVRATAGTIAFAPHPDALPASRLEVDAMSKVGGRDTRVLIGADATKAAFLREAPARRVIHLATYGVLNKENPLFSFVDFAPAGADDGRLEAHEVFGLRLAADLVVLSACQTGLASGAVTDVPAGDDWVGLAKAFLSAGALRVMASLWPVQDRATASLMTRFYERYAIGGDPGAALAVAQRTLLAAPATANPYYWAGFEVIGGR